MRNITSLAVTFTLSLAMLSPFHTLSAENEGLEGLWNVVVTPNALFLCNGPQIISRALRLARPTNSLAMPFLNTGLSRRI